MPSSQWEMHSFQWRLSPNLSCGTKRIEKNDIFMSLKSSPVFSHLKLLKLKRNMRLKAMEEDPWADMQALEYPSYLLQVEEGEISGKGESQIILPPFVTVVQNIA